MAGPGDQWSSTPLRLPSLDLQNIRGFKNVRGSCICSKWQVMVCRTLLTSLNESKEELKTDLLNYGYSHRDAENLDQRSPEEFEAQK